MAREEVKKHLIQNFGSGVRNDIAGIYIGETFVPDALNVDFSLIKGAARKRKGYVRLNAGTGLGEAGDTDKAITGIYQDKLGGTWQNLICAGSGVYAWDIANDSASPIDTGQTEGKNYLYDFTTARTSSDGPVIIMTNGVDQIKKWDGTTFASLSLSEGYNFFKAKCCVMFNNYCFFANNYEGANFADDWTNTAGDIYSYDNADGAFQADVAVAEAHNSTTALTENTSTPTTPASGEYGISSGVFYVNIGGAPSTNIHVTYQNKERVRWMDLANAEGYTADQFIDVVTTPGKEIRAIKPLRDLLIVYKEDSIWAIYYTGDATAPFGLYCIDQNTPCIAGHSVADVKGEHYFLSEQGIMKTNGAKVEPVLVSKNVPEWFNYISITDWQYAYGETNEYMKQYRLLVPYHGATDITDKDREVRYDYEDNTWSAHEYAGHCNVLGVMTLTETGTWDTTYRFWDEIHVDWEHPSLWSRHSRFFSGDYSGYLRMHDTVERDDEGTAQAINSYFFTKPLHLAEDLDDINKFKRLYKVSARLKSYDNSTIQFWKKLDGYGDPASIGSIDCGQTNVDFTGKLDLSGRCREIEYKIGNNASVQPWAVYWLQTEFKIMSEK